MNPKPVCVCVCVRLYVVRVCVCAFSILYFFSSIRGHHCVLYIYPLHLHGKRMLVTWMVSRGLCIDVHTKYSKHLSMLKLLEFNGEVHE